VEGSSRDKTKAAGNKGHRNVVSIDRKGAFEQTNDCRLPGRESEGFVGSEFYQFDRKQRITDEQAFACGAALDKWGIDQAGFEIVEGDAGQGLFDVEFTRFAIQADAIPIEYAIGGVRVLLDFENDEAAAKGVNAAAGEEHGVAGFDFDAVEAFSDGATGDFFFELLAGDATFEADEEFSAGLGVRDVPEFGFGFTFELDGTIWGWMDLQGKRVAGIEDFDQQRKAVGSGSGGLGWRCCSGSVAEQVGAVLLHQPMKIFSCQGAIRDDTNVAAWSIADFPRFTNGFLGRERLIVKAFEVAPAPDALFEEGAEGEGIEGRVLHAEEASR